MRDRLWLVAYLAAVLAIGFLHRPMALALLLAVAVLATGRDRWRLLRRALLAVLAFNLSVSLGHVLIAGLDDGLSWSYLALVNLRVLLLVYLGFWTITRIDLGVAVRFSPTLSMLLTLTMGQIATFRRLVADHRLAFTSRSPGVPRLIDRSRHAAAQGVHLLDKSVQASTEITQAMRARGCFDR